MMRGGARGALVAAGFALGAAACSLFANLDQYEHGTPDAAVDAAPDGPITCNVDTTTSQQNCGACGHDCQGALCSASVCTPQMIAADTTYPVDLAVDGAQLFWADEFTAIKSCAATPIDGGAVVASTALPSVGPGQGVLSLAVGASSVFFTTAEGVAGGFKSHLFRIARSAIGTSATVFDEIATGADVSHLIDFVLADNDAIYWGVHDGVGPTSGSIDTASPNTVPNSGGTVVQAGAKPHALAMNAKSLVWIERTAEVATQKIGSVLTVPRQTGMVKVLVAGIIPFDLLAVGPDDAYFAWSDGSQMSIRRATLTGGALMDVVPNVNLSGDILATDGTTLVWSTIDTLQASITLWVCTLASSCTDPLAVAVLTIGARAKVAGVTLAPSAAIGGDWLYWAEPGNARIQRVSIRRH